MQTTTDEFNAMVATVRLSVLDWLKMYDRVDANKYFVSAMHCVDRAQSNEMLHSHYMRLAKDDFERALKHLERLVELNLNGRSTTEIR